MSVTGALGDLVATLDKPFPHLSVLIESAKALALEIDMAQQADDGGKTKAVAGAVRELRAVCDELILKGRSDADTDEGDWSAPAVGSAPVRHLPQHEARDLRSRGGRGGAAAG